MPYRLRHALASCCAAWSLGTMGAARGYAQGAEFGASKADQASSNSSLDSATPTNSVDEVAGPAANADGSDRAANASPAEENASTFNIDQPKKASAPGSGNGGDGNLTNGKGGNFPVAEPNGAASASPGSNANLFNQPPASANATPASPLNANANAAAPAAPPPLNAAAPAAPAPPQTASPPKAAAPALPPPAPVVAPPTPPPPASPTEVGSNEPEVPASALPPASGAAAASQEEPQGAPAAPAAPSPGPAAVTAGPVAAANQFAGAPPMPGTMRTMAEGEAPEEYVVEPGDNLYDICEQLLDEPGYWPKLWAMNPEIKNPHFIFPNMRLRFYPGDDDVPPYLQVVAEDDVIPIDKGDLEEADLVAEHVNFPQHNAATDYIVEVIGPSQVDALKDEILTAGQIYSSNDKPVHVPGFIYSKEIEPVAVVKSGRDGEGNTPEGSRLFVEAGGKAALGTLYTILRSAGEVDDPDNGDFVGYRYYFVANIKLDHVTEEQLYSGVLQDSQFGAWAGDLVVPYISTKRIVPINDGLGPIGAAKAHIVGWNYAGQELGGRGHIALIDKGATSGVSVGSYLKVYATPGFFSLDSGSKDLPVDYQLVGAMRIIDVTDAGASGYVVRSTEQMRLGDRTNKN